MRLFRAVESWEPPPISVTRLPSKTKCCSLLFLHSLEILELLWGSSVSSMVCATDKPQTDPLKRREFAPTSSTRQGNSMDFGPRFPKQFWAKRCLEEMLLPHGKCMWGTHWLCDEKTSHWAICVLKERGEIPQSLWIKHLVDMWPQLQVLTQANPLAPGCHVSQQACRWAPCPPDWGDSIPFPTRAPCYSSPRPRAWQAWANPPSILS